MNRKLLLSLAFILFAGFGAFAQTKNDPAAKTMLDAVSNKFKNYKSFTAKFTLSTENSAGKKLSAKAGTLYMKGKSYKMVLPGQDIYSDGSNIWTYDQKANEVTITKFDPNGNGLTPQKLYTSFYDDDYFYKMNDDAKIGNITYKEVELTPKDKTMPFFKVLLRVKNNAISSAKIFEKSGGRFTYTTTSVSSVALPESTFSFNAAKYPGVEVVDLR